MVDAILKCEFKQDHLEAPGSFTAEDKRMLYRFMQQAILDAHLPVMKATGFSLNTPRKLYKQSATKRCSYCLENMIEIASNLDDKIFFGVSNNHVISDQITGIVSADMDVFTSNTAAVKMLYLNKDIMTTIKPLSIDIYVDMDTGYKTMKDNSDRMGKSKYFPMNSYHTITDYVRVLPFNGEVRYRLVNGMTLDILREMFLTYYTLVLATQLGGEELRWVSSFQQ